jgi:hypothetical protein
MKITEATLSNSEVKSLLTAASETGNKGYYGFGKKKPTEQDLERVWKTKYYGSNDHNDIVHMLIKDFGFSKRQILPLLRNAHETQPVKRLAAEIKRQGLQKQAIEIIKRVAPTLKESVVLEKALSDKDIKQLFVKLVQQQGAQGSQADNAESTDTVNSYVKKWASEIKQATDPDEKLGLVKEIVNFLADRHTTTQWQNVKKGVQDIIKRSGIDPTDVDDAIQNINQGVTMESATYELCNSLLQECGIQWQQLGVRPVEVDEGVSLCYTVSCRETLLEDFLTDLVNLHKIQKLHEQNVYGRSKK